MGKKTKCASCGDEIRYNEEIMSNLTGAYHKGDIKCMTMAYVDASAPPSMVGA